jgi:subtilisin family serine protease
MSTRLVRALCALALATGGCVARDALPPSASVSMKSQVDRAFEHIGGERFAALGGRDGAGVTIAVIDSGFDVRHPAIKGRARWMLDHGALARGAHGALEARFGGAVWDAASLASELERERSAGVTVALPEDSVGHGTFVASVAAGASREHAFEGVAPGAALVLARVGSAEGIADEAIITALDFAIDRAGDGPLVVVLAAGSVLGAHDGSAPLERAIAQRFAGHPRRVLVVAAGNEGGARSHRRAYVRRDQGAVAIGLSLRGGAAGALSFSLVHEGALDVALEGPSGERTRWVALSEHPGAQLGAFRVGIDRSIAPPTSADLGRSLREGVAARTAIVTIERDRAQPANAFRVLLRGDATVDLYAPAEVADLEGGDDSGTLVVPATADGAVVVNAIVTREQWTGVDGSLRFEPIAQRWDGVARFASLGPDRLHRARPDLSAPGGWVLGARSAQCAPDAPGSLCARGRLTSSSLTVAAAGTSVAAPVAAGAIARLWSTDAALTPDALVARLTAGSERWSPSLGWGAIDLARALTASDRAPTRCTITATREQVVAGEPVTFALRAMSARGAIEGAPTLQVSTSVGARSSTQAMAGGRGLVTVRTDVAHTNSTLLVRATVGEGVACEASVRVRSMYDQAERRYAGCSVTIPHRRSGPWIAAIVCALLSAGRGRRRRCSARS